MERHLLSWLVQADNMIPTIVVGCKNVLGESAFWSVTTQQVRWVDADTAAIHSWNPMTLQHEVLTLVDAPLGMILETSDARTLAFADRHGVALLDLETYSRLPVSDPERGRDGVGYNDAKVDPRGRLWLGTYDSAEVEPRGCVWLLEGDQAAHLADSGFVVVNGPTFSPDGGIIYVSDSVGRRILAYDIRENGSLARRRIFAQFLPEEGLPDGLTTDAEGCIWCAHWDGARVTRFSPQGERLTAVPMPVPRVTSVAFGGSNLSTLFVTTARYGLSPAQLRAAPGAGALFAIETGIQGRAATPLPLPFTIS